MTVQEWLRGATLCPRSVAAGRSYPASKVRSGGREDTPQPRSWVVTLRSHPEPQARGGSWEEPPMPEARASDQEDQPEE